MTRTAGRLFTLALFTWTLCFVTLQQLGTWTPFAFVGVALASLSVWQGVVPPRLLRPTVARITMGVAAGALMVVATHLGYRAVVGLAPPVAEATGQLLVLLNVDTFSPEVRGLLIVMIASCEEALFRGLLPISSADDSSAPRWPSRRELTPIVALAALYALTTLPLGSALLVLCAFACGSLWGLMRVATGSLVVPLLAHVVWDLGVLLVWPLAAPRT